MQPIDVVVLVSAALSVFYLPFLSGRLVVWLLFGRRRRALDPSQRVLDLTVVGAEGSPESLASCEVLVLPDARSEVLDFNGLLHYLTDQRASEADVLLSQFLHPAQLAGTQRP